MARKPMISWAVLKVYYHILGIRYCLVVYVYAYTS